MILFRNKKYLWKSTDAWSATTAAIAVGGGFRGRCLEAEAPTVRHIKHYFIIIIIITSYLDIRRHGITERIYCVVSTDATNNP